MELEKSDGGVGNENRIGQVKTITKIAVLNKILFVFNLFYINALLIAVRLWLIFRVLEKVHSVFTSFLTNFVEERILGVHFSTIFSDITLLLFITCLEFA